jgi:Gpi18-like mannosyltransferase
VLWYLTLVIRLWRTVRLPLLIFSAVTCLLFVDVFLSTGFLPLNPLVEDTTWFAFPDSLWLDGWTRFDGGWYWHIAKRGYYYAGPNNQSAVAFFPAYPLAMRFLTPVFAHPLLAAIAITIACGGLVSVLFHRWALLRTDGRTALASLLALLLYPLAYYLTGAAYADAMFLAAVLGAFLAVESDRPFFAGVLGALATATRPVGLAIVVGLFVLTVERPGPRCVRC